MPFPLSFFANGFQHPEQMLYSLPSISRREHFSARPHMSHGIIGHSTSLVCAFRTIRPSGQSDMVQIGQHHRRFSFRECPKRSSFARRQVIFASRSVYKPVSPLEINTRCLAASVLYKQRMKTGKAQGVLADPPKTPACVTPKPLTPIAQHWKPSRQAP